MVFGAPHDGLLPVAALNDTGIVLSLEIENGKRQV
jgi:hypothetical protein